MLRGHRERTFIVHRGRIQFDSPRRRMQNKTPAFRRRRARHWSQPGFRRRLRQTKKGMLSTTEMVAGKVLPLEIDLDYQSIRVNAIAPYTFQRRYLEVFLKNSENRWLRLQHFSTHRNSKGDNPTGSNPGRIQLYEQGNHPNRCGADDELGDWPIKRRISPFPLNLNVPANFWDWQERKAGLLCPSAHRLRP